MSLLAKILMLVLFVIVVSIIIVSGKKFRSRKRHKTDSENMQHKQAISEDEGDKHTVGMITDSASPREEIYLENNERISNQDPNSTRQIIVVHILAQSGKQFIGYELLQAILASGLRFGEMDIFHRYQELSGKGDILFSLACSTEPGTFEMQKMGNFSCSGLTLFLCLSNEVQDDIRRFELFLETAQQLATGLEGGLYDEARQVLDDEKLAEYRKKVSQSVSRIQ